MLVSEHKYVLQRGNKLCGLKCIHVVCFQNLHRVHINIVVSFHMCRQKNR